MQQNFAPSREVERSRDSRSRRGHVTCPLWMLTLLLACQLMISGAGVAPPLAGNINVCLGRDDNAMATISHPSGASCQVYLANAHVTSWMTVQLLSLACPLAYRHSQLETCPART